MSSIQTIYKHYMIDLSGNHNFVQIPVMQGDGNHVRGFEVELISNGTPYVVDKDNTVVSIMGTKPDTRHILNECEVTDDGCILVDITSQMSAVPGRGDYSIVLMDKNANSQLKSFPFYILTTSAPCDIDDLVSTDEFQLLTNTVSKALDDYTYVMENAQASADAAKISENNTSISEQNAGISETNSAASASHAAVSEKNAETSEQAAALSADEAAASSANAAARAADAADSAADAELSASAANTKASEAADSASSASASAMNAAESAAQSSASAANAAASAADASDSASSALASANTAAAKSAEAADFAESAADSKSAASLSADTAGAKTDEASGYATEAESWAHGGTGTRENEDADNAKKYYEQCRSVSESFAGTLRPMGTVAFADLSPLSSASEGDMYNVSDEFVTTEEFKEGSGHIIPAGANIYKTADGCWDVLAGSPVTGVKGSSESSYRRGNVNITKTDIGLGSVPNVSTDDQTPTFAQASSRTNIASGEKLSAIFGKIAKWFADLKAVAFSGSYNDLSDKPSIPSVGSGTITITQNGTSKGSFTVNQSQNTTIALTDTNTQTVTGIKGSAESGYRTGNVNITPANIGLGNVNNTADSNKSVNYASSAGNADTLDGYHANDLPYLFQNTNSFTDYNNLGIGIYWGPGGTVDHQPANDFRGMVISIDLGWIGYQIALNVWNDEVYWRNYSGSGWSSWNKRMLKTETEYLPLTGGTCTGSVKFNDNVSVDGALYTKKDIQVQNGAKIYALNGSSTSDGAAYFYVDGSTARLVSNLSASASYLQICARNTIDLRNPEGTSFIGINASAFNTQGNSSRRLKEHIEDITDERARQILDVRVVTFDYKEGAVTEEHRYDRTGVIAEDTESVCPEVINYDDNEPSGVQYDRFIPYLIRMTQLQQEEIDRLKADIQQLKSAKPDC